MNFTELNIRRPVMTTLVMIGIMIFGVMAYRLLPVSDLNVDFPVIQVMAALPGASPETMASSVATPLERQFSTIAGLDAMSSGNTQGSTTIVLQFNLNRNIDAAAQDVQAAIAKVQGQLPQDMPSPPSYQKVNPADQPILYIALTSRDGQLPLSDLHEWGDTVMAQRIGTVSGVAQVQVLGGKKRAVRIQLDPKALASRGIGIDEVSQAIQAANVNLPTGTLYGAQQAFTVQAEGQLRNAADYNNKLIVTYRNDAPVYLRDVGVAIDSVETDKAFAWYGDQTAEQPSLVLGVQRQPGTNTVEVAKAVKQLLPVFQQQLPASVDMHILYDRSDSIQESVDDVQFTLLLTLGLVVMVIFIFIRNLSATIIPSLALPLSVVGTFSLMYMLGYSLDNLSLMALTLAVGFVVDDAIVVLENIVRHSDMGKSRMQAALDGAREIGFTVVSMTISLAAVFIPVLFMGGIVGRLFRSFSVTIGAAVLVSGFVSLTLTPMLCSRFLRATHQVHHGLAYRASEAMFNGLLNVYKAALGLALRHRISTLLIAVATLVGTVGLFKLVPAEFSPSQDLGVVFAQTEADQGVSWKSMAEHQQAFNRVLRTDPDLESYMSVAPIGGVGFGGAANAGISFIKFKHRSLRTRSVDQIMADLRPKMDQIPGLKVYLQNPMSLRTDSRMTKAKYEYTLQGPDTAELFRASEALLERLKGINGLIDVNTDLQLKSPQVNIPIDRQQAAKYGVTVAQIESALYDAYGGRQVSTIFEATNQYRVIMEVQPQYQTDPNMLSMLYLRSSRGGLLPLSVVTRPSSGVAPLSVNHQGQLPSVTLSYNLKPELAEGDAAKLVQAAAQETLPATITGGFAGQAQAMQSSQQGMMMLLIVAFVVIYLVLGILYESFLHPITILSALPLAFFGAMLTLWIFNVSLSIYAFVGMIMLVGLVKKNGIMMVDFAVEAQRAEGKSARDAIFQACLTRFRPITMTTMAALMAGLPIALGYGAGAELRRPLGLAVVGGLLFSQLLTLFVTPVFYIYMDKVGRLFKRRGSADALGLIDQPEAVFTLPAAMAVDRPPIPGQPPVGELAE